MNVKEKKVKQVNINVVEKDGKEYINIDIFGGFVNGKPVWVNLVPRKELTKQEYATFMQELKK